LLPSALLKFLFDFFPVILFFVAFKVADIYWATGVAIGATVLQIGYVLARGARSRDAVGEPRDHRVFGGATLLLRTRPSSSGSPRCSTGSRASVFLGALAFRQNLVKAVMSEGGLELPEPVWTKLAVAWGVFFLFKGTLNLWVAHTFSTETWVNFKLFGGMG
jgi:intracellular septation protein